ncbi:MAG: YHS domain-containing protein [Deltaproteobacteria bacterium]|nr:YHS domain-containing protein [Deltaproteobacteria bacterium]
MALDEVCGRDVDEQSTPFVTRLRGEIFYFCSEACQACFELHEGVVREGGADNGGRGGRGGRLKTAIGRLLK